MSKQKKAIISLSVVCVAILIALITVVSVWAATSQTVSSQLTIRYSATNVTANIVAEYKLEGETEYTEIGTTSFLPTEASTSKAVTAKELNLTDEATFVTFRYSFTNNGSKDITVTLDTSNMTANNVTVRYAEKSTTDETSFNINGTSPNTLTISAGNTQYAYIRVSISSQANDASYVGTLNWNIVSVTE